MATTYARHAMVYVLHHPPNMPEGPSIVILREAVQGFKKKKILHATGNAKIDMHKLEGKTIRDIKSWGKHLLICFDGWYVRIHLLMFGSYRINEQKDAVPRLSLQFKKGELNFYTCSVQVIEKNPDEVYDWGADVMSPEWDEKKAAAKLKKMPQTLVCDALLDQNVFSGVGNIIKNEVLFRIYIHPKSEVGGLPVKQRNALLKEAVAYSYDFLAWKKAFVLKKHWLVNGKKMCPRCAIPLIKDYLGKTNRRSFFCNNCQVLYDTHAKQVK
jgi:endonuclease-8